MKKRIGKWLHVYQSEPIRTRDIDKPLWMVMNNDEEHLGLISYFKPWRKHIFRPEQLSEFDAACLSDLVVFMKEQDKEITSLRSFKRA